jgi:hypothetical protein
MRTESMIEKCVQPSANIPNEEELSLNLDE